MYEICVGEGGMTPEYFARVSLSEALCFMRGVMRRYREGWRQTRFATYVVAAPNYKNMEYENLLVFPWEEERDKLSDDDERKAIERMRSQIPAVQKMLKNKKKE